MEKHWRRGLGIDRDGVLEGCGRRGVGREGTGTGWKKGKERGTTEGNEGR